METRRYYVVTESTPGCLWEEEPYYTDSLAEARDYARELLEELALQGYITPDAIGPDLDVYHATDEGGRKRVVEIMAISETLYLSQQ